MNRAPRSPLPRALMPLTIPLSWLYGSAVARRNRRFDRGGGVQSVERPVISVGNITTGGTGKTPMVAWMARRLIEARLEPLIAMRGYKSVGGVSDEQEEYRSMLVDPHVIANPNRAQAIEAYLPSHPDVRVVILDDGFQHRQVKRDLDLVLIDATAGTIEDRLLPAGNLREPLENLRRADAVIVTHADIANSGAAPPQGRTKVDQTAGTEARSMEALSLQIEKHHGKPPIAWCRHVWTHLTLFDHNSRPERVEVGWLAGKHIITMLGVGKPGSVMRQLRSAGANIVRAIPARDHEQYRPDIVGQIERAMETLDFQEQLESPNLRDAEALVVTQKDWVKLAKVIDWKRFSLPIVVPRLALEFVAGEAELLDLVLERIRVPAAVKPAS